MVENEMLVPPDVEESNSLSPQKEEVKKEVAVETSGAPAAKMIGDVQGADVGSYLRKRINEE